LPRAVVSLEPQLGFTTLDGIGSSVVAALPLLFNTTSIKSSIVSGRLPQFSTDSEGHMAVKGGDVRVVQQDIDRTLKYLEKTKPNVSTVNERALRALAKLTLDRGIPVYLLPAPIARRVERNAAFREWQRALRSQLGAIVRDYPNVRVQYDSVAAYARSELESMDHLRAKASGQYTSWVMEATKLAANEAPSESPAGGHGVSPPSSAL
jgi:hypothetical protein